MCRYVWYVCKISIALHVHYRTLIGVGRLEREALPAL